jgi:hypothetical protein
VGGLATRAYADADRVFRAEGAFRSALSITALYGVRPSVEFLQIATPVENARA